MLTEAAALPVAWAQTAEQMSEACHEFAGGVDEVLIAANQLNSIYHLLVDDYETKQAIDRGDWEDVGRRATHTTCSCRRYCRSS